MISGDTNLQSSEHQPERSLTDPFKDSVALCFSPAKDQPALTDTMSCQRARAYKPYEHDALRNYTAETHQNVPA